mgnify:CR=1 FL=1
MADKDERTLDAEVEQVPADPWAAAFAALGGQDAPAAEAAAGADGGDGGELPAADQADQGEDADAPEGDDGAGTEEVPGGPGDLGGADGGEDAGLDWDGLDVSEEQVGQYRESFLADIQERTISDVAKAYIDRGARHTNGRLGATINDPDVCKRDRDGVPRFYNPETGREFTGDNPRRQAQEWVDDYNRELADAFNRTCQEYSQRLMEQEGGRLAVLEFAPKYKALDPMRRSMFEAVIEDYEVTDENGDVVAYSCDLDKALAAVNRQVQAIQRQYGRQQQKPAPAAPSGPALDTPSTAPAQQGGGKPQFKSLAEAMEWEQDQLLAKRRNAR